MLLSASLSEEAALMSFNTGNSVLLACAFLEADICFLVLFSFSQHLVGATFTDD